ATLSRLQPAPQPRRADGIATECAIRRLPSGPRKDPRNRFARDEWGGRFDRGAVPPNPMTAHSDNEFLFTSESVTEAHADMIADHISDGVLAAVMRDDAEGRVACETLVNTGLIVVSGEITTTTYVDIADVARETVRRIGYTDAAFGFDFKTCAVI